MPSDPKTSPTPAYRPFRRAMLRGLGILMPPLLTIVLFIWAWSIIERYVLVPVENPSVWAYQAAEQNTLDTIPFADPDTDRRVARDEGGTIVSFTYESRIYSKTRAGKWVGRYSDDFVRENKLPRWRVLLAFLSGFVIVLYLLGKFVAAKIGGLIVNSLEQLVHRLPLINNVYSSVKQVTDFVFVEREIEFNRVVAVEYPRKGMWSIGFVTGESMLDIRSVANESVLSVLMPTSPMPMTGFTITVRKSEAVDLNITIDQAVQFVVSCGVVVPPQQQLPEDGVTMRISSAIAQHGGNNGQSGKDRVSGVERRESRDQSQNES